MLFSSKTELSLIVITSDVILLSMLLFFFFGNFAGKKIKSIDLNTILKSKVCKLVI